MRTRFFCAVFLSLCLSAPAQTTPAQTAKHTPSPEANKDAPWPTGELTERQMGDAIEQRVKNAVARNEFSGVFAAFRADSDLYQHAFGVADEKGTPIRPNTRFMLGSLSEVVTSVAIAQLVQAGKLRYEDTLAKVLPSYPDQANASLITVQELLTHTSGLPDYRTAADSRKKSLALREPADYFPLIAGRPLSSAPGKTFHRSNSDNALAAAIIEVVSGQHYADYLRDHIFRAAHMKDTALAGADEKVPSLAAGFTRKTGEGPVALRPRTPTHPPIDLLDGLYSTGLDVFRFARALRTNVFLNPELTEKITTGVVETPDGSKYGYGFFVEGTGPERVLLQRGEAPGINTELEMMWDGSATVVILSNYDPPAPAELGSRVMDFLRTQ